MTSLSVRRSLLYSVCAFAVAGLCAPAAFGSAPKQIGMAPTAGLKRPAAVPEGYVITPFGYFHPSCVRTLASGEMLLADGRMRHADGTTDGAPRSAPIRISRRGECLLVREPG